MSAIGCYAIRVRLSRPNYGSRKFLSESWAERIWLFKFVGQVVRHNVAIKSISNPMRDRRHVFQSNDPFVDIACNGVPGQADLNRSNAMQDVQTPVALWVPLYSN